MSVLHGAIDRWLDSTLAAMDRTGDRALAHPAGPAATERHSRTDAPHAGGAGDPSARIRLPASPETLRRLPIRVQRDPTAPESRAGTAGVDSSAVPPSVSRSDPRARVPGLVHGTSCSRQWRDQVEGR